MPTPTSAQVTAGDSTALFRALWDDAATYVAFEVTDWDIQAEITKRDGGVWQEDSVELFFHPENNGGDVMDAGDVQFIVNTLGTQEDYDALGSKWSASWESAVSRTPKGYTFEMSIPWSVVGFTADDVIGLSFALNDKDADGKVHAQWGGYTANSQTPSQWKEVGFSSVTAEPIKACN
jgi:hypothetical protein